MERYHISGTYKGKTRQQLGRLCLVIEETLYNVGLNRDKFPYWPFPALEEIHCLISSRLPSTHIAHHHLEVLSSRKLQVLSSSIQLGLPFSALFATKTQVCNLVFIITRGPAGL